MSNKPRKQTLTFALTGLLLLTEVLLCKSASSTMHQAVTAPSKHSAATPLSSSSQVEMAARLRPPPTFHLGSGSSSLQKDSLRPRLDAPAQSSSFGQMTPAFNVRPGAKNTSLFVGQGPAALKPAQPDPKMLERQKFYKNATSDNFPIESME